MKKLYEYITQNYKENEPIFSSDIKIKGMTQNNIRVQLKNLMQAEKIKRFDSGIYFLPRKSIFGNGSELLVEQVIDSKYLQNDGDRYGYISGLIFCNQIGLTSQIPMQYEVVSNKATSDYRETTLARSRIIIRKPRVKITEANYKNLQFLDMIKDVDIYSEITGQRLRNCLFRYMEEADIKLDELETYYTYYPDKLYRNLVETGVIYHGILT